MKRIAVMTAARVPAEGEDRRDCRALMWLAKCKKDSRRRRAAYLELREVYCRIGQGDFSKALGGDIPGAI